MHSDRLESLSILGSPGSLSSFSFSLLPVIALVMGFALQPAVALAQNGQRAISCLGRLEPGEGVLRLASPTGGGVIGELKVKEGDLVEEGEILATLMSRALRAADVARSGAELDEARQEASRLGLLSRGRAASASAVDSAHIAVRVAEASLNAARSRLELTAIRSPISGQVLEVHARAGEAIGPNGVLELGEISRMMAVAEVYETDIGFVQPGQLATITSPALDGALSGKVERVGLKIGRLDVIGSDPVAKTDARVVEVRIALNEPERARALTHLQVEVEIAQ